MTNRKTTRRALVLSLLSLLVCCSMLVGTTFAWFTDSVTSGNNKIVAGNLDIELEYANTPNGTYESVVGAGDIFVAPAGATKGLWEPGHTEVAYLKITNAGTLSLKYQLQVAPYTETIGKNADGGDIQLSKILKFAATEPSNSAPAAYTRESAQAAALAGNGTKLTEYTTNTVTMAPGEVQYIALVVYMPETVGNEANYRGDIIPTIQFALSLYATQVEAEKDSFGDDYDANAGYDPWDGETVTTPVKGEDGVYHITNAAELVGLMEVTGNSIFAGDTILLENNIDLGGNTVKGIGGQSNFSGIFDGQGFTIRNFKIDAIDRDYYAGLFNQVSHGGTVKNLTVKNATVIGNKQVGAVASSVTSEAVIDNCKAIDCTVIGDKKVGAVVGYSMGSSVTNNYAENCTVLYNVDGEAGEVYGYQHENSTVSGNTAKNVTVAKGTLVSTTAELQAALSGGTTTIALAAGEYELGQIGQTVDVELYGLPGAVITDVTTSIWVRKAVFSGLTFKTDLPVQFYGDSTIKNCTFENGGSENNAIAWCYANNGAVVTIENCKFVNDRTAGDGRAIHFDGSNNGTVNVKKCVFDNNCYVAFNDSLTVKFDECDFKYAMISAWGDMALTNCTFGINSKAKIYSNGKTITMDGCTMEDGSSVLSICSVAQTGTFKIDGETHQLSSGN